MVCYLCFNFVADNYLHTRNMCIAGYVIKYDGHPSSVDDCKRECDYLNTIGFTCGGFNFHLQNRTCQYIENSAAVGGLHLDPDVDYDCYGIVQSTGERILQTF